MIASIYALTITKIISYIQPSKDEIGNIRAVVLTVIAINIIGGMTISNKNINIYECFFVNRFIVVPNIFSLLQIRLCIASPPIIIIIKDNV